MTQQEFFKLQDSLMKAEYRSKQLASEFLQLFNADRQTMQFKVWSDLPGDRRFLYFSLDLADQGLNDITANFLQALAEYYTAKMMDAATERASIESQHSPD
jgi:hypothetical protein